MLTGRELVNILLALGAGGASWWYFDRTFSDKIKREVHKALQEIKSSDLKSEVRIIEQVKATYEDVLQEHEDKIKELKVILNKIREELAAYIELTKSESSKKDKKSKKDDQ